MSIKNTKIANIVAPQIPEKVEVEVKKRKLRVPSPESPKAKPTAEDKKKAKLEAARKLIAEHERLVKVLDSGTPKAQKKEAKVQKKDLVEAKKDLVEAKKEVKELKEKPKKEVKEKEGSAWIEHVKKVQASKGISYREAMKVAKDSYKK